jgi:flagellar motor switch/type III secretory pathway protein FliN
MNDPQRALGEMIAAVGQCLDIIAEKRRIELELRDVETLTSDAFPEGFTGPCVVARAKVTRNGLPSSCALLFQASDCLVYVGLMLGLEADEIQNRMQLGFREDDVEAFSEAMNQAFPALLRAASGALGETIESTPPTTELIDLGRPSELELPPPLLAARARFQIEGFDRSTCLLLWPPKASPLKVAPDGVQATRGPRPKEISRAMKIEIPISVLLARKEMTMKEVFDLAPGSIIEFSKPSDEDLDLLTGDQKFARGVAAKSGDKFCFRINKIARPKAEEPSS